MSSIRLRAEHDGHQAGEVISRPFLSAKELVAQGIGEYLEPAPPPADAPPPRDVREAFEGLQRELAQCRRRNAELAEQIDLMRDEQRGEIERLTAERDAYAQRAEAAEALVNEIGK